MAKLILKMSMSLDAFVAGPGGEMDWMVRDDESDDSEVGILWNASAHLMGSRTFKDMQAFWPVSDEVFAPPMNAIPKVVFSKGGFERASTTKALEQAVSARDAAGGPAARSPDAHTWDEPKVLTGDLASAVSALKAVPGKPLLAHGGAGFARSLIASGTVDEYRMFVHPVVLGRGMPIFDGLDAPIALHLVSSTRFPSGTVALVYRPD